MTCNLVVAGDFNARIDPRGKAKNVVGAKKGVILCNILRNFDLLAANQEDDVTFISGDGTSTIDLIFFDPSFLELQFCETTENIANCKHIPVKSKFFVNNISAPTKAEEFYISYKLNEEKIQSQIHNKWDLMQLALDTGDIDGVYNHIIDIIYSSAASKHPSTRVAKPWFNSDCKLQSDYLNSLKHSLYDLDKANQPHNAHLRPGLLGEISLAKSNYRELIEEAKIQFAYKEEEKIVTLAEQTPYTILRSSAQNKSCPLIPLNLCMEHFSSILNKRNFTSDQSLNLQNLIDPLAQFPAHIPFSDIELQLSVDHLKNNKAPGPDKILNEHIKIVTKYMRPILTQFFNKCVTLSATPHGFNFSLLKLLFKGKGDKADPNNYRGIALCNSLPKLLDKMIMRRIIACVHNIIPVEQFGFLPGRSCTQAIQRLFDKAHTEVHHNNKMYYVAFLDFEKAFDNVNREKLLTKLISLNLFSRELLTLIAHTLDINFLSVFNGVESSEYFVQSNGTLQGSSLSPLYTSSTRPI